MPQYNSNQDVLAALTQGAGGLQFTAQSPPGIGRKTKVPFFALTAVAQFAAGAVSDTAVAMTAALAAGRESAVIPIVFFDPHNLAAAGASNTIGLTTPQVPWASLRITGFEVAQGRALLPAGPPAELNFSDLQIGGGPNLFVHEDFGSANLYDWQLPTYQGLRDYPVLNSPNQATVSAQVVGVPVAPRIWFSCCLVCEVVVDDQYGAHIPGPAARRIALTRAGAMDRN
jgi:hypothetical protein